MKVTKRKKVHNTLKHRLVCEIAVADCFHHLCFVLLQKSEEKPKSLCLKVCCKLETTSIENTN